MERRFDKFFKIRPIPDERLECLGRIGAHLLEICEKLLYRNNFEHKACQIPS